MKSTTSFIFLIGLQLCAISGTSNLIEIVCQSSEDKNLCYSTYNNAQKADLNGLAMMGLNQASGNATAILNYVQERMGQKNLEPLVQQGLIDCANLYQDAVDQVDDSIAALEADAFKDVRAWVEAALSDAVACQEAFTQHPNVDAKLTWNNGIFIRLCKNVLAANKQLAGMPR